VEVELEEGLEVVKMVEVVWVVVAWVVVVWVVVE
jgi:hypothetical protein